MDKYISNLNKYIQKENYSFLILLFIVTIYPFIVVPGPLPYFYGPRYIVLALVSIIALIFLFKSGVSYIRKADLALITFFLFLLISTFLSENIATAWGGNSLRFTGASTYLFCGILFVLASRIDIKKRNNLIKPMIFAAAIVSIIAIMQNYGVNPVPHESYRASFHSYGTMGNPNFLGSYTVFILPAAMMMYLHQKNYIWLVCSGLIFAALLTSLTRGSWLGFAGVAVIIAYYVYKNKELRKRFILVIAVFIITSILLSITSNLQPAERASTISDEVANVAEYTDTSGSIRVYVWQESLLILKNNWAFGIGADNISIPVPRGYNEDKAFNTFLEIAVTMGIFALFSFMALLYFSLKQKGDWVQVLLCFMILAYLFQGQFNIDVIMNLPLFWIVLGLAQAFDENHIYECKDVVAGKTSRGTGNIKKTAQLALVAGLVGLILLASFLFYMPRTTVIEEEGRGKYEGQVRGLNTFHGNGIWEMENGAVYQGEFKHGYFDGYGKLTYSNGSYYKGEFKEGHFHGKGKLVTADGDISEGTFRKGNLVEEISH